MRVVRRPILPGMGPASPRCTETWSSSRVAGSSAQKMHTATPKRASESVVTSSKKAPYLHVRANGAGQPISSSSLVKEMVAGVRFSSRPG